jgi:hypothetical protein
VRTPTLAALTVFALTSSACFQAADELVQDPASEQRDLAAAPPETTSASKTSSTPEPIGTCSHPGSPVPDIDEAQGGARLQGRWLRCGAASGRIEEASPLAREALAFEIVGDRWFVLTQGVDGTWVRAQGALAEGTVSWWTTNRIGVTFERGGRFDPALVEFLEGGVRLDFYPGATVVYVPLR